MQVERVLALPEGLEVIDIEVIDGVPLDFGGDFSGFGPALVAVPEFVAFDVITGERFLDPVAMGQVRRVAGR